MNARMRRFEELQSHPFYSKQIKGMRKETLDRLQTFLYLHKDLNRHQFALEIDKLLGSDSQSTLLAELLLVINMVVEK